MFRCMSIASPITGCRPFFIDTVAMCSAWMRVRPAPRWKRFGIQRACGRHLSMGRMLPVSGASRSRRQTTRHERAASLGHCPFLPGCSTRRSPRSRRGRSRRGQRTDRSPGPSSLQEEELVSRPDDSMLVPWRPSGMVPPAAPSSSSRRRMPLGGCCARAPPRHRPRTPDQACSPLIRSSAESSSLPAHFRVAWLLLRVIRSNG